MVSYVDFLLMSPVRVLFGYTLDRLVLAMILNPRAKRESKSRYGVRDLGDGGGGTVGG